LKIVSVGVCPTNEARAFFEDWFQPLEILTDGASGHVTGYYEPELTASDTPESGYRYPFLRKPDSLIKVPDPDNPPAGIPAGHAFMIADADGLKSCPDRQAIESGAFEGEGLEIAWAGSPVDVFFAHIQGCARLCYAEAGWSGSPMPPRAVTPSPGLAACWSSAVKSRPRRCRWLRSGNGLPTIRPARRP
jgi:membrane-bound lytic murein transglycosylase A